LIPKVLVVGHQKLNELIEKNMKNMELKVKMTMINASVKNVVSITKEHLSRDNYDVILSAGGNLGALERNITSVPIISITPVDYDFLKAISLSYKLTNEVVILPFYKKIDLLEDVEGLFSINVRQEVIKSEEHARETLLKLKGEGISNVIGGSMVERLAKEIGISCTYFFSDESIVKAIREAERVACSIKQEQIHNRLMKTVLDLSENGFIVSDADDNVQLLNKSAKKIFKLEGKPVLGKKLGSLFNNEKLYDMFMKKEAGHNQTVQLDNTHIVFTRIPLINEGKIEGLVISFSDVDTIRKTEQSVRNQLHKKGLYATYTFQDIIGSSPIMRSAIKRAKSYGLTESTILINGESGTGKELFAQSIHNASRKVNGPFVAVNCAAIPENLLESELFGYEEGSFTGAKKGGKMGLFELAHNGTIFLDEIGEISPKLQSQLLRVLQEKRIRRVGSDKIVPIDVRVICATNRDLLTMVRNDTFREDLYYRLNVLNIQIPPLRERNQDIPELVRYFLEKMEGTENDNNLLYLQLDKYMNELKNYQWPGNIRELENFLEKCYVIYHNIGIEDLVQEINFLINLNPYPTDDFQENDLLEHPFISTRDIDKKDILSVLEVCNGNKTKAAEKLGISRATLWRKLKTKSV
jgi:transcriptional regulator, propionate catabolism operon regulatory protein